MTGLNDKQRRFAAEYLVDLNATQAAIRAGYSAKTAYSQGQRLLKNVEVATLVEQAECRKAKKLELNQDMIVAELRKIGFSDTRKLFTPGGALLPIQDMDDETAGAIASVEVVTKRAPGGEETDVEYVAKLKLWDKPAALVNLGKHLGMWKEKLEIDLSEDLAAIIAEGRARLAARDAQ